MVSNGWQAFSRNTVPVGNVYPGAHGATTGQRAGAQSPITAAGPSGAGASAEKTAAAGSAISEIASRGLLGQPATWWLLIVAALVGLMMIGQKLGDDSDFGNVRLSIYNVITISLAAIIGISFFKVLFARFPIPGLSDLVNAV